MDDGGAAEEEEEDDEWILGSAECSVHEFEGTELGKRRPEGAVMYVTEVAVSPVARRCGTGRRLMKGIEELATVRRVETLYLHVDVTNSAACAMYDKAGYEQVDKDNPIFQEFTTSLNLQDGATKGRKHFLLCKNLVESPTWLIPQNYPVRKNEKAELGFVV
mmetsp:Transcript_34672/g.70780  ORF Transcript_34672/g.70780 Transcript_34672/m.70780 type:complete len:162 (-) Transcript_34672:8-493(-)